MPADHLEPAAQTGWGSEVRQTPADHRFRATVDDSDGHDGSARHRREAPIWWDVLLGELEHAAPRG